VLAGLRQASINMHQAQNKSKQQELDSTLNAVKVGAV